MSEGLAHAEYASTARRRQPAYGDGRLAYEEPAKGEEHLDGRTQATLAVAICAPVVAAYAAAVYGVYLALAAIL